MDSKERGISRRLFLAMAGASASAVLLGTNSPFASIMTAYATGDVSYSKLPRWRGFNLVEKKSLEKNKPFQEWDFDTIAAWGFDFVRLPLDYRIWTKKTGSYNENQLKEIDQAITWARARGIHVNLCLHRAPGYSVGDQKTYLWADGEICDQARADFADQWRMFAVRYRGISSSALSFNLVNEPPILTNGQYLRVAKLAVDAIRSQDSGRLIIADGTATATLPAPELAGLKIAQSLHAYRPMELTHYKASWIPGSDKWPVPTWPLTTSLNQYLYGNMKSAFQSSLILKGNFLNGSRLSIKIQKVSYQAQLQIRANGAMIKEYWFKPGPGQGDWKVSTLNAQWGVYQATYDKEYSVIIPAATHQIEIAINKGDWLTFSEIRVDPYPGLPNNVLDINAAFAVWGQHQTTVTINNSGKVTPEVIVCDKEILWKLEVEPWKKLEAAGIGVHVGEFGAYQFTPHEVVLAWMTDQFNIWKQTGWGWALWNLRGSFGVLDSERADVSYEDYKGHKLDRKMLALLQNG